MPTDVSRREWFWVTAVAAAIVAASAAPFAAGYLAQTEEWVFTGMLPTVRPDNYTYLAKMWQGYWGSWQYQVPFTTEPHQGAYLVTFYLALGHLARWSGLNFLFLFHAARVVFGLIMLLLIYRFVALFTPAAHTRRLAFLLATTASGLGWLTESIAPTRPGAISPMDFWLLDGYIYLSLLAVPHFCAAISLLLVIFIGLLRRPDGPTAVDGGLAILAGLGLALIHPYMLLVADLLPLLYVGVEMAHARTQRAQRGAGEWRIIWVVLLMGLTQTPVVLYQLWVYRQPVFAEWAAQNLTLSPPPMIFLAGYGALLALAAIGLVRPDRFLKTGPVWRPRLSFAWLWLLLVAVLIYSPTHLQRRFLEGVQIPLGLLAGVGLSVIRGRDGPAGRLYPVGRRLGWLALALTLALMSMTNLYLTIGYTVAAVTQAPNLFWPRDVIDGVEWLGEHTDQVGVTLAAFDTGNLIPAWTDHRVVLGHEMETVAFERKRAEVAAFFAAETAGPVRQQLLEQYGVAYVFHGPAERALGDFDPATAPYLAPVFQEGDVVIYQVREPG